jgi:DNA-binding cell septation regulator SpoVG
MNSRSQIPDLRADAEITLEHCSVLLEKIGNTLEVIDGQPGFQVATLINPELLLEHYEDTFQPEEFCNLFRTEMGKGVLVGTYVQRLLERIKHEQEEDSNY